MNNTILAKLMTLEYIDINLFKELNKWYKQSEGVIIPLQKICEQINSGKELTDEYARWNTLQVKEWIKCAPVNIYEKNLSRYFYLTRDVLAEDNNIIETLTAEEREVISQIIEYKGKDAILRKTLSKISVLEGQKKERVIQGVLRLYDNKQVDLKVLYLVFDMFSEYRYLILDRIKQLKKADVKPVVYPILKSFYDINTEQLSTILKELEKKKVLTKEALEQYGISI